MDSIGSQALHQTQAHATETGRGWLRAWLLAFALVASAFGGWELFWRARGFVPSVSDDERLWAVTRERASNHDPDTVVLVGSSRLQLAIDPDAFSEATGWRRPIQLAIAMGPSLPILRDLAEDPAFRGIVVCEIHPDITFNRTRSALLRPVALAHLWAFHGLRPVDRIEERLQVAAEQHLVSRQSALSPGQVAAALWQGALPERNHRFMTAERFTSIDLIELFGNMARTRELAPARFATRPFPPSHIPVLAQETRALVERIRARGGEVLFVRLPSGGSERARERAQLPRELYWDVFAERVGAASVHFEDHPSLAGFRTPDEIHIGGRDSPAFSRALGKILAAEYARMRSR